MSQLDESEGLPRLRPGTCHRCGWAGPVGRLPRSTRRSLPMGRLYARVCVECAHDLTQSVPQPAPAGSGAHRRIHPVRLHRDVA